MLYPDAASLAAIGTAITRAYLPTLNLGAGLILARRILRRQAPERSSRTSHFDASKSYKGQRSTPDRTPGRGPPRSSGTAIT
ncbi:lysyltransferase [Arthrobacter sp. Hiyo8]|nr:lysyltransferase [Arthrobacter sp. Hiyo8]